MDQIKAKFQCDSVIPYSDSSKITHLHAVYGTEGENADFTKATPSGQISIMISNDVPASKYFHQGAKYYVYFEKIQE